MYDRALQALFVMALEPEFEATFENNSYGFRPDRSPIDAMKQIQLACNKLTGLFWMLISQNVLTRLIMKSF